MTRSFRNVGPQVFISYCFKDKEIASRVSAFLTSYGCRVRMEDEVSLIGHRLDLTLPERIRQGEVFVQLRTASAVLSQWMAKELEYASVPHEGSGQLVIAPVAFERGDLAALGDTRRAIDATLGLSDEVLEVLGARTAEAVYVLPLSDADPFRFEPSALARVLRTAAKGHRRVILDSDNKLQQWMKDCLDSIESSVAPHKQNWLLQERKEQEHLVRFLEDLDGEAARLIASLVKSHGAWNCSFPGSSDRAMDYFCTVRVGLAVIDRAAQVPAAHELRTKYAGIFKSLLERLPRNRGDYSDAYLYWIAGPGFSMVQSATKRNEYNAERAALRRAGIDDDEFAHFVETARWELPRVLGVEESYP